MKGNIQMQNWVAEAVEQVDGKLEAVDDQIMGEVEIGNGVKVVDAVVVVDAAVVVVDAAVVVVADFA